MGISQIANTGHNPKGCEGGPKVPGDQKIVCHFSQGGHKNS